MNPWDNFTEAPYFALVKEGTEIKLGDVPVGIQFVNVETGARFIVTTVYFENNVTECTNILNNEQIEMSNDTLVLVDDRILN